MKRVFPRYLTNSPVIVCGLPRSGTSLTRDLINTSSNVLILDEFPVQRFTALFAFAGQLAQADQDQYETWRGLSSERGARIVELLATAWALVSREALWRRFREGRLERVGMKTPLAELDYGHYAGLLAERAPLLVYCWRPPLGVYDSLLSLAWGAHYTPESFLKVLESSLEAIGKLRHERPKNVFVFDVARTSISRRMRMQAVAQLFAFLGAKKTWQTIRFVGRWPAVNPRGKGLPSELTAKEKEDRLAELERLLKASKTVEAFRDREGVMLEPLEVR